MKERFFAELSQILKKRQIETGPQQHGMLPVLCDGTPAFWVEPNGMQVHKADDVRSVKANRLFAKVAPISEAVCEYVSLMKRAPLLQSDSGNQDYSLLADFNGVILAGKELGESGYKFATWYRDSSGTGYNYGNYFGDNYKAAKADFAQRSGLIEKGRYFTDVQLTEIYGSINDTLQNGDLADDQAEILNNLIHQLEQTVPDLEEHIAEAPTIQFNQQFNM